MGTDPFFWIDDPDSLFILLCDPFPVPQFVPDPLPIPIPIPIRLLINDRDPAHHCIYILYILYIIYIYV